MMALPLEIIDLILSFLNMQELTELFDLDNLCHETDDFTTLRQMALCQCYNNKLVTISNEYCADVKLTEQRLNYLCLENLLIQPKSLTIILNPQFNLQWLNYLKSINNIHIIVKNKQILGIFHAICASLQFKSLTVTSELPVTLPITIHNLLLHLFNPKEVLTSSANFQQLTSLDLSYNNLLDLSNINFPSQLKSLNLSNNSLWRIDNLQSLTKLTTLDLSNNNLVYINVCIPSLIRINLLGNNLINTNFLLTCFTNLLYLDLSRNLISNLTSFPPNLISINLACNYLSSRFDSDIFPHNLQELDVRWCKLNQDVILPNLPILRCIS